MVGGGAASMLCMAVGAAETNTVSSWMNILDTTLLIVIAFREELSGAFVAN